MINVTHQVSKLSALHTTLPPFVGAAIAPLMPATLIFIYMLNIKSFDHSATTSGRVAA
jgi:hypothetical protein